MGKNSIDVFIPSHGDYDHIGGAVGLARNLKINNMLLPWEVIDDENKLLYTAIEQHTSNTSISYANKEKCYNLGSVALNIIYPSRQKLEGNDASTLVEVVDKLTGAKILFTGDLSHKREERLRALQSYDVLKVGHHGSNSSSSYQFLKRVSPSLAVISCGLNNRYGHPHKQVLERLKELRATIVRTDYQGCIKVEFTEEGIRWQGYRKE